LETERGNPALAEVVSQSIGDRHEDTFPALFLFLAIPSGSAAQNVVGRIAVDSCYNYWYLEDYEIRCDVSVFDPGGWGISVGSVLCPKANHSDTLLSASIVASASRLAVATARTSSARFQGHPRFPLVDFLLLRGLAGCGLA
jgi:hypothetical protein